jgi:hypothetical protein
MRPTQLLFGPIRGEQLTKRSGALYGPRWTVWPQSGPANALRRSANVSWFKWLEGSAPFFWNWGVEYQRGLRDGQPHYTTNPFPQFMQLQKGHKDPAKHELMRAKVVQVRKRRYILPGKVVGGTHYFCVDKGEDDIRMVYNGTSCGLNDVLWAPRFGLPTVKQTLRV